VASVGGACSWRNLRRSTQSPWPLALPSLILDVVAVGGVSADMSAAGYIILIALMLVPIVWLAWIEPGVRYALICLAILGAVLWILTSLAGSPGNTLLTGWTTVVRH
jgi:hypothetical protein